jgi:hypothetical protein
MVDGPNLFAYVGNNPVLRVDPLGLQWGCWLFPDKCKKGAEGVQKVIASCSKALGGTKVWHRTKVYNRNNPGEYREFQKQADEDCQADSRPGLRRWLEEGHSVINPFPVRPTPSRPGGYYDSKTLICCEKCE